MPDEEGNQSASSGTSTPLHAYASGTGTDQSYRHPGDVQGDPTGQDVVSTPVDERQDPEKHSPNQD